MMTSPDAGESSITPETPPRQDPQRLRAVEHGLH